METVNIFLTGDRVHSYDDFLHDGVRYVFGAIDASGPQRLIEGPVWIFVDWVMYEMSGLELCKRLRTDPLVRDAHITMVLENDDHDDRRRALRSGADDYMLGPVDRTAVLDRVLALDPDKLRQNSIRNIQRGDLFIDLAALEASWAGVPVRLRLNEFRLLCYFAENANRVLTRGELVKGLGKLGVDDTGAQGDKRAIDQRAIDVSVGRLRRALKAAGADDPLRTVRTIGYVLDL